MAKHKKKVNAKTTSQQKRHRRQWVTFMRMCRYGVNNFTRNAWLTLAATAVMTITLFVVFTSVVARNVLVDTLSQLRETVQMSIYLETETVEADVDQIAGDLRELPSVLTVAVASPDDARANFVEDSRNDLDSLAALKEATNKFPWTLSIKVVDINDTSELSTYVTDNEFAKERIDESLPPSFAGSKRQTIETIAGAANFAQNVGIVSSIVFVGISMLIIFNTIRMAIFNRREEIQMMKLIGAEKSFIRGPFVVEAIVYGFFAALFASALGYTMMFFAAPTLRSYFTIDPTLELLSLYVGFVLLGMIVVGALLGIISSLMATRRYLKL